MMMRLSRVSAWLGPILVASSGLGDEPRPATSVRLAHPDRQMRSVLALFEGAKAPHPAAALAAWKRAVPDPGQLGKPMEALIASFNPRMADELRSLDAAEVALRFEPGDGRLAWDASMPRDDGTIAALASAFALSGGRAETPMGEWAVDRLGGPGSAWMARGPRGVLMAGSLDGLAAARDRAARPSPVVDPPDGLLARVEAGALAAAGSIAVRRLAEALGPRAGAIDARTWVADSAIRAEVELFGLRPIGTAAIEPGWLDWIPLDRASAAFALAVDPQPGAWDRAFEMADRVERVDPARADVAPIRLRLDLLARTFGVRPEADILPHLDGLSAWVGSDGTGVDAALVALHLDSEAAAERLAGRFRQPTPPGPDGSRSMGQLGGRPLRMLRQGRTVAIAWGDGSLETSMAARRAPERSAGPALGATGRRASPACIGGVWPARIPGLVPAGSPLARALADAPPVAWAGSTVAPGSFRLSATWGGLAGTVHRFLELIPLDPPPDR